MATVNRWNFLDDAPDFMDGFVHNAEGYAKSCAMPAGGSCSGSFTDTTGERAMGYYDQGFPELLLLHGVAVRGVGSLVLAGIEQERSQSHRHLHRRHDSGTGQRSG